MKKITLTIQKITLFLFISLSPLFSVEISSPSQAVDIAGKQRMYSQKILKEYAMIGMNNAFGNPSKELNISIESFTTHLDLLLAYNEGTVIDTALKKIQISWKSLEIRLRETAKKDKVALLQEDLEILLADSNSVTKLFAQASQNTRADIVNISGKQRMLSQRMASLYMLQVWGIKDLKFKTKLTETMTLFKTSHEILKTNKNNTASINKKLKSVKRSFTFFEMMAKSSSKYIPSLIYKKSNEILKIMNQVTEEYVHLSQSK